MPRLSFLGAALALIAAGSDVHAQEVVKIDTESGRTIIDDEWRSMYRGLAAVDWDRKLLYVSDREEPDGIMVFSLETGEHVRTISTPRGDGPQELKDGRQGIAIKPDGGTYISGYLRVLEFDPAGNYLANWSPVRMPSQRVCDFGGAPAVATQGGVLRRGPNGEDQVLGSVGEGGEYIRATTVAEGIRIGTMLLAETHIVCTDDAAYVVAAQEEGPATVTIYRLDGSVDSLEVPVEGASSRPCTIAGEPCPHWSRRARVSLDDHDNLVILGADSRTHGSIINPETGCYALIHADGNRLFAPAAIHADSALVFYDFVTETRDSQGRIRRNIRPNSSPKIAMHPIRRYSGEPCEGILPNVPSAR